jgi:hypothetical protein
MKTITDPISNVDSVEKLDTSKVDVTRELRALRENPRVMLKMDS